MLSWPIPAPAHIASIADWLSLTATWRAAPFPTNEPVATTPDASIVRCPEGSNAPVREVNGKPDFSNFGVAFFTFHVVLELSSDEEVPARVVQSLAPPVGILVFERPENLPMLMFCASPVPVQVDKFIFIRITSVRSVPPFTRRGPNVRVPVRFVQCTSPTPAAPAAANAGPATAVLHTN